MLKLNLQQALANKGIENPNLFLKQCGITSYTATRLLHYNIASINFKHLELICLKLNCTIDDIFVWKPDKNTTNIENHPLQKLKQKQNQENINQIIKQLPFNKIDELRNFIDKLNNK